MQSSISFSASSLVKSSASQILFLSLKNERPRPTKAMLEGTHNQQQVSTSAFKEMRGIYTEYGITVFFCIDEIQGTTLIEHKYIVGELPDWFLYQSIIQTALYSALTHSVSKLETASFFVNLGNPKNYLDTRKVPYSSILKFTGNCLKTYKVECLDNAKLIKYFIDKAFIIASKDFTKTRAYDAKHKFKDWEFLKSIISYSEQVN